MTGIDPAMLARLNNIVNEDHYKSIGKVASNWAGLEMLISSVIWRLAKVDDLAGVCLTAQIPNTARQLDALIALAMLRGASDVILKSLEQFAKSTAGLQAQRNRVIHDPWHVDHETGLAQRIEATASKTVKFGTVPVKSEEFGRLVDLIADQIEKFDALAKSLLAEIET